MISAMWLMSLLVLQVFVYLGSSTVQDTGTQARLCHRCAAPGCAGAAVTTATCPTDEPYCATVAITPNATSSLTCARRDEGSPCELTLSDGQLRLICTCATQLCNSPFTQTILNQLTSLSERITNTTDLLPALLNATQYVNVTEEQLYEVLTEPRNVSSPPQPQALRALVTPSDDDEDEGEGSGAPEDHVSHPPQAPAHPSSYLPAENKAGGTTPYPLVTIPLFILTIAYP